MEPTPEQEDRRRWRWPSGRAGRALVVGVMASTIGLVIGLVAAVAGPTPASSDPGRRPLATSSPSLPVVERTAAGPAAQPTAEPSPEPTEPSPAGFDLADGVYPAFIRDVNVAGSTVTVDLIQVFEGPSARRAAIEDGTSPEDARYLFLYVRNDNDLLRTLPVARDVRINFMGVCETPPSRHAALTELRKQTTPFDTTFYYSVGLSSGEIERLGQHLAIVAC